MECIVKGFEPISLKPESNPVDLDCARMAHGRTRQTVKTRGRLEAVDRGVMAAARAPVEQVRRVHHRGNAAIQRAGNVMCRNTRSATGHPRNNVVSTSAGIWQPLIRRLNLPNLVNGSSRRFGLAEQTTRTKERLSGPMVSLGRSRRGKMAVRWIRVAIGTAWR